MNETPGPDTTIDLIASGSINGLFKLHVDREGIFRELARVMRPGGTAYMAEVVTRR